MKKLIQLALVATIALVSFGCEKSGESLTPSKISGEWKLSSWDSSNGSYTFDDVLYVYVELKSDKSFNLYQNTATNGKSVFTGTYTMSGNKISGKYSDGANWIHTYIISGFSSKSMVWSADYKEKDISKYAKTEIPTEVKSEPTRTNNPDGFRFL